MTKCTCTSYSVDDYGDCPHCEIKKDNARMLAEDKAKVKTRYCAFCGRNEHSVSCLVAGPTVYICGECIQLCADVFLQHLYEQAKRVQDKIKEMEDNGGIPAIVGVSDMTIPDTTEFKDAGTK